jgi:hypothetical protein
MSWMPSIAGNAFRKRSKPATGEGSHPSHKFRGLRTSAKVWFSTAQSQANRRQSAQSRSEPLIGPGSSENHQSLLIRVRIDSDRCEYYKSPCFSNIRYVSSQQRSHRSVCSYHMCCTRCCDLLTVSHPPTVLYADPNPLRSWVQKTGAFLA